MLVARWWRLFDSEEIQVINNIEEHLRADQNDNDPFQSHVFLLVQTGFDHRDQFQGEIQPFIQDFGSLGNGEIIEYPFVKARQNQEGER